MSRAGVFVLVLLALACGGRQDALDPWAADRDPALVATADPWSASYKARELALAGFVSGERGDHAEAERLLGEATDHDPGAADLLAEHARTLIALDRIEDARKRLRRALEADPAAGPAWLLLAQLEFDRGDTETAFEAARRAIHADPRGVEAALWLARRLAASGERGAAEELLAGVLARRPSCPGASLALADIAIARGDLEGARRHLRFYAETAVAPGSAIAFRVSHFVEDGDPARTADLLELAVAAGGAAPGLRLDLVRLLIADGRLARARRHLMALPPAPDGDSAGIVERATLFLAAGAPWEARRLLLDDPASITDDPRFSMLMATIESALGRVEAAAALGARR